MMSIHVREVRQIIHCSANVIDVTFEGFVPEVNAYMYVSTSNLCKLMHH